jgi:hypothetical protein
VSILLLAAVHCLKSIKLRLDLTALYIAGECATFSNSPREEGNVPRCEHASQ